MYVPVAGLGAAVALPFGSSQVDETILDIDTDGPAKLFTEVDAVVVQAPHETVTVYAPAAK